MTTTARPYHHGNLREALLAAAERALEATGAQDLSLRELAREVGVSHAAPRRHFADKQALLDALALNGFEQLGTVLAGAIDGAGADFEAQMLAFARAYTGYATAHPALIELMFAAKHKVGGPPELAEAGERAFAPALATVVAGQAAGIVVPGDPERVAIVAFAALQGLVALTNTGFLGDETLDDLLDEALQRLMFGLRVRA